MKTQQAAGRVCSYCRRVYVSRGSWYCSAFCARAADRQRQEQRETVHKESQGKK